MVCRMVGKATGRSLSFILSHWEDTGRREAQECDLICVLKDHF